MVESKVNMRMYIHTKEILGVSVYNKMIDYL